MLYDAYQNYADLTQPARALASQMERMLRHWGMVHAAPQLTHLAAGYEIFELAKFTHTRPEFEISHIATHTGERVDVTQATVMSTPFCDLVRFSRQDVSAAAGGFPRVLLVAPMSGHFATLLRGTIRTLLRDHEVYVTDWRNARDIPLSDGVFALDDFTQHIIDFIKFLGPQSHVVAVCQPTVSALAAVAVMAQAKDPDQPASLTLMAGPIDTRISPTKVNELAMSKPIEWFREKMIDVVPRPHAGAGRRVYPGFIQLAAFMSMNTERHMKSFRDLYSYRGQGDLAKAEQIRTFYEEYFAIMDLDGAFYLETIETVFQTYALPQGKLAFKGETVQPAAIRKTFLLTVEGEKDDICAVGQTLAAQDLCSGLRPYMKSHHLQAGVGHYGVFSGRKWETQIYPMVRNHIQSSI
ncbi:MAG: poly(3-hydroxybutyrate) depolymerase [Hyphomicrobiales bacterium]|nr:poly(3-hydroxybutyrate) depolymerase [Hyphomicrobiales bacterium]